MNIEYDSLSYTIRKEKTYDVLSLQRENGSDTKILGKSDISKKQKKGRNRNEKKGRRQW